MDEFRQRKGTINRHTLERKDEYIRKGKKALGIWAEIDIILVAMVCTRCVLYTVSIEERWLASPRWSELRKSGGLRPTRGGGIRFITNTHNNAMRKYGMIVV